jgi:hypothetical protein
MFTPQELIVLIRICDAATRQGGLDMAELTIPISQKIRQHLQSIQQTNGMRPAQSANGQENEQERTQERRT